MLFAFFFLSNINQKFGEKKVGNNQGNYMKNKFLKILMNSFKKINK